MPPCLGCPGPAPRSPPLCTPLPTAAQASLNTHVASTNFAKTLVANLNMMSYCDVTNSVYPATMTTIRHCSILGFGRGYPIKQSPRASPHLCTPLVLHAWIFSTGSSARIWSVFCCVRTSRNETHHKKVWGIVSLKTPKAVYSASERKYTAAGGDVQVPWGNIHEWPKSEQRNWYMDWQSKLSSAWNWLLRGDEIGAFKDRNAVSFQFGLCSDPHLWSRIFGDDWKNTVKRTYGRDGIFAKSSWCDTSWQSVQVWNP